ncbi:MAG: hypothetical protein CVU05_01510 [Bacteroidetes bacterium HGW-Bacteroidetes-21]|jgi:ligand-binding sensor domain-containing protein|nr:MAG: hypothetical protein CVU05_01510 [Bacteroidetes bacterium HGW-Bacteroidetes-21]
MKKLSFLISLLCLLFISGSLNAQSTSITNYTTANGLPDDYVSGGVVVDQDNNKWFGTANGVARFSETEVWTVFTTTDGVISNYISAIAVDKMNNVWVGSDDGVSKFDGTDWTSYTTADGLVDNAVIYIHGDPNGGVWFATYTGVSRLYNSTWTTFTSVNGLPTDAVNCIASDSLGNTWFGTLMGGAAYYDGTDFTVINISTGLPDDNVFAIGVDASNNKYIGTWYGITKLDNSNNVVTTYDTASCNIYNDFTRDIQFDNAGNMWAGFFADYNQDGGVSFFNGISWTNFSTDEGLVNKQVIRLALDDQYVWVATGMGVSRIFFNSGVADHSFSNVKCKTYPNPVQDYLTIEPENISVTITISDLSGKQLLQESFNSAGEMDTRMLNAGMYLLQISDGSQIQSSKLIVE